MDSSLQQQIQKLHDRAFIVDAHFDLTYEVHNRRERGERQVIERDYLPQFKAGGFNLIVSAIFIHDYFLPEMGLRRALDQIACLHEEIDESPGKCCLCRTTAEAVQARKNNQVAIFLSLEGAEPLQNDIHLLRIFYELGVRGLGLVWSRRNYVGDGAFFTTKKSGQRSGISSFGIQLIEEAEKLGMFIDVSHLNDEGFWDVIDITSQPVIASHSNCRSLASSMRNLTDVQITAIARKNGVIGMNSINKFVRDEDEGIDVSHLVDHLDHIVSIAGVEHVGIGFDLCDSFKDYLQIEQELPSKDVIETHAGLGKFTAELLRRNYSEDDILKILGGNFLRIYQETID
ncbi:dipeptidase [Desulforhopalus sp. IMCC35007]|uniref:dipeptidase n=1 Tax=Desulforhopalus sp. IMCC35007 TaxID=2569543 RepID=UPI0010AEE1CF|nr:dipeptidase [Desulforhopalus sp. IMCC35007]TKB11619.1 membrane dipeptidase [Desulforhopalus sp. IMCC35007]